MKPALLARPAFRPHLALPAARMAARQQLVALVVPLAIPAACMGAQGELAVGASMQAMASLAERASLRAI